jgi:sulfoxide reductase heme-binding subunit YedZ
MLRSRWAKVVLWILCLAPLVQLSWLAYQQELTANPLEFLTHFTGDWTINLLVTTLAITPLRKLLRLPDLIRFRRPIGLFAFFYGSLHFLTYLWFDKFFDTGEILKDVVKRPFITMGFAAFILMLPLAVTSTTGWIRRMGGKRWQLLHRLVYFSGIAAVIHYYWLVKADVRLPVTYGTIVFVLLLWRSAMWVRKRLATPAPRAAGAAVTPNV